MSQDKTELILNTVLLTLQLCLGLWQFMKLTPVGALIQAVIGRLVQPLPLFKVYSQLRECNGRLFKRANCFALEADIPPKRRDTVRPEVEADIPSELRDRPEDNTIELEYLGRKFRLERKGEDKNMLFIALWKRGGDGNMSFSENEMRYYITPQIWKELQTLKKVLRYDIIGPPLARATVTRAAAQRAEADAMRAEADAMLPDVHDYIERMLAVRIHEEMRRGREKAAAAHRARATSVAADKDNASAMNAREAANKARKVADDAERVAAAAAADAKAASTTLFVKGKRDFWEDVITGGVMELKDVLDAIILYNKHVSVRLNNDWLLPVNLSVSEEKLLKILNLVALFLQTKKVKVRWFIPLLLSFISALLEFSTRVRHWLYTKINVLFCDIMHVTCDRLPRPWRRQVYSLGRWVENLTPCNDIQLKVVRSRNMCAIITEGARIDKEGATRVPWLDVADEEHTEQFGFIEKEFGFIEKERPDNPRGIKCTYVIEHHLCEISAPTFSVFYVKCTSKDDFSKIITLVSCMAQNGCGSLISYDPNNKVCGRRCRESITCDVENGCGSLICCGPNNKVRVRGFRESLTSYVDSGLPRVYTLQLDNVVVA